jgi:hypothetical protein
VQEHILHIELVNWLGAGDGQGEHSADSGRLDHRAEGLIVVDAGSLGEVVKNPTNLVLVQGAVRIELVLENLLACDDVGVNRTRDKIIGVAGDQGSKLFFHGAMPVRIGSGGTDRGRYRRQGWCRDGQQGESVGRKLETLLCPRGHWMRIDWRSHRYGLRQRRLLM